MAPSIVRRVKALHGNAADSDATTFFELDHLQVVAPYHGGAAARNDYRALDGKCSERAAIQVIPMRMRDEDRIERPKIADLRNLYPPPDVEDAATEQRIGQQPHAPELNERGCMSDVGELALAAWHYGSAGVGSSANTTPDSPSANAQPCSRPGSPKLPTTIGAASGSTTPAERIARALN